MISPLIYRTASDVQRLLNSSLPQRKREFLRAREAYYNSKDGSAIMKDEVFDRLEKSIKAEDAEWKHLKRTGIPVAGRKFKRALESFMPSLSKFYPEHEAKLLKWASEARRWVVSAKMDGSSVQATYDYSAQGALVALSTRGNGVIGKSIDHFISALVAAKVLPARLPGLRKGKAYYRMEAVVPYSTWRAHYSKEFDSARAMSSAVFNRNDVHPSITKGHVRLVVVQVQAERESNQGPLSLMLRMAKDQGFSVVKHEAFGRAAVKTGPHPLSVSELAETLRRFKFNSAYELDGLVIQKDDDYYEYTQEHPDFAYAFKENSEEGQVETTVEEIEWEVSRTNRVVPRARLKPVMFDGVTVTYATLNNAKWAMEKGIGAGAKVLLCRSGEVIPKILKVTSKTKTEVPSAKELGVKELYMKGRDMMAVRLKGDQNMVAQKILFAMRVIGVEHLARAAADLIAVQFSSPLRVIAMLYSTKATGRDSAMYNLEACGISRKIAEKTLAKLPKTIPMAMLMKASGVFDQGLGERRFQALIDANAHAQKKASRARFEEKVITAIGNVMGQRFLTGVDQFWTEYEAVESYFKNVVECHTTEQAAVKRSSSLAQTGKTSAKLKGQAVTFTGYRDAAQEEAVMRAGGTVVSFGLKTTILLFKEGGKASSKIDAAKKRGVRVCTFKELGL